MPTACGSSSRRTSSTAVPWMNVFSSTPRRSRSRPGGPRPAREGGWLPLVGWPRAAGTSQSGWFPFQLAQDDAWKCPHCQVLQQGMVKLSLWTLPDILIIHLKRFCQVGERRNKLSTLVKFPLSGLNMAPHVAQRSTSPEAGLGPWPSWKQPGCLPTSYPLDFLYDLYAVCNHHGNLQGGHYTGEPCLAFLPMQLWPQPRDVPGMGAARMLSSLGHLVRSDPSPNAHQGMCESRRDLVPATELTLS